MELPSHRGSFRCSADMVCYHCWRERWHHASCRSHPELLNFAASNNSRWQPARFQVSQQYWKSVSVCHRRQQQVPKMCRNFDAKGHSCSHSYGLQALLAWAFVLYITSVVLSSSSCVLENFIQIHLVNIFGTLDLFTHLYQFADHFYSACNIFLVKPEHLFFSYVEYLFFWNVTLIIELVEIFSPEKRFFVFIGTFFLQDGYHFFTWKNLFFGTLTNSVDGKFVYAKNEIPIWNFSSSDYSNNFFMNSLWSL